MSKIGKIPVEIKDGVTVIIEGGEVKVSGSLGIISFIIPKGIDVKVVDRKVVVFQKKGFAELSKATFGLTRATVANMIKGVSIGFEKKLQLSGVGFRAQMLGGELALSVGFSHAVKIKEVPGIKFSVAENVVTVSGADKTLVGDIAAKIRAIRSPDPYKAKGISYVGERIRRKAGKAAKTVGTK